MPTTPVHALRYPAPADPADVPADMGKLAADVDVALLPSDVVCAAATRLVSSKLAAADANPQLSIRGDGRITWGAGGASATDTDLYRSAAGTLATDSAFELKGGTAAFVVRSASASGNSIFVSRASGDTSDRFIQAVDGWHYWGPGNAAWDTSLYRMSASTLRTAGAFVVDQSAYVAYTGSGYLYFGSASDASLSRGGPNQINVGTTLYALNHVISAGSHYSRQGNYYFGAADDVVLSRRAANQLQVNGELYATATIYCYPPNGFSGFGHYFAVPSYTGWCLGSTILGQSNQMFLISYSGTIEWGPGNTMADTWLYRNGINILACYNGGAWGTLQAAAFAVQSDRTTKSDVETVDTSAHVEQLLKAGIYSYRRDDSDERHLGLMADELPEDVILDGYEGGPADDPNFERTEMQFVDVYKLSAALLAAIQHLNERVAALEAA
jgi:endosialidase-like protein